MFKIIKTSEPYKPILKEFTPFSIDLKCNYSENFSPSHCLFLTNETQTQIFEHIGWNKITEENNVEQGGILLGNVYYDEIKGLTYGIVKKAIAGRSAIGSSGYLLMTHDTWKEIIDEIDINQEIHKDLDLQIIGLYHTHPNFLDVFMSSTDRATQSKMFGNNWQFAVVLNPHRQIWRVFFGNKSTECKGAFLKK